MAARVRASVHHHGPLLPAGRGHFARADAGAVHVPDNAIEPFLDRVAEAYRGSLETGREHGFLAYVPGEAGLPHVPEPTSVGGPHDIRWRWDEPDATVAFSFHTHPGGDALCAPSGVDAIGALIRGDHVVYVLTHDGRLSGWRFREPHRHPRAVDAAMRTLASAHEFTPGLVEFLYDAFETMRGRLMEPVYAARLALEDGGDAVRLERPVAWTRFFSRAERR